MHVHFVYNCFTFLWALPNSIVFVIFHVTRIKGSAIQAEGWRVDSWNDSFPAKVSKRANSEIFFSLFFPAFKSWNFFIPAKFSLTEIIPLRVAKRHRMAYRFLQHMLSVNQSSMTFLVLDSLGWIVLPFILRCE